MELFKQETENAEQFIRNYYSTFDSNRQGIVSLYRDISQISFEGSTVTGPNTFLQKLQQMGIPPNAAHRVITVDAQPSVAGSGALLVFVTGEYVGQQFSEVFQLVNQNGMYIHNDIFRVGNTNPFNVPDGAKDVAKQFIEHYYGTFRSNRNVLESLYRPQSCFTFETNRLQGTATISEKLRDMPGMEHDPSSLTADVHQINGNQLLLVFVTGRLLLTGESNPLNFTETFILVQEGGGYFVGNQVFKFRYG